MDIYAIQEEAYKRGYEAGVKSVGDKMKATDREKLIEVLKQNEVEFLEYLNKAADAAISGDVWDKIMSRIEFTADHLIASGVRFMPEPPKGECG